MGMFWTIFIAVAMVGSVKGFFVLNANVTEPDMIRNVYLRHEKLIWDNSVNNPAKSRSEKLKSIFNDHKNFINTYLMNTFDIEDLKAMIHSNGWHKLQSEITNVDRLFTFFRKHLTRESEKETFNEDATIDLTDHILNDPNWPLQEALENIHKLFVQEKLYFVEVTNLAESSCSLQRSAQQILYQLYSALTIVELEAYIMMQCSYMWLSVYNKAGHADSAYLLRSDFIMQSEDSLQSSQQLFEKASRTVKRCDPETHQEGVTFLQITRLLQGHIENERDLNRDRTCTETCGNYKFTEDHGCSERSICNRQPKCLGKILDCIMLRDDMRVCPAGRNSSRRYEYIAYDDGGVLGERTNCYGNDFYLEQNWKQYLFLYDCDHCICICDEQGKKSDRFFSLRPAVSDTRNNMVVTGIRFVKDARFIHLQIQESELIAFGKVDEATTRWVPISKFSILDKGVLEGVDYHMLQYNQREVDFDDLIAPSSHVVTGVQFRRIGRHLNLQIRISEINFITGRVEPEKSYWWSSDNTENSVVNKRKEIHLKWPQVPTKAKRRSVTLSSTNTFIKFTHSDIGKDAAQTTVPFLDAQEVTSIPAMPLQGIGLYYKGEREFGGFIAPKIETLDFSSFIKANLLNFRSDNDV